MIKRTITFKDFNDNESTETLYFNLSKSELLDNLHMKEELESIQGSFDGEARELTVQEVAKILQVVKTFMRLSYGVRSEDGKRFAKSAQLWEEFTQTAAYDAFLMSLFENPEAAVDFMTGVVPADLRQQAEAEVQKMDTVELPDTTPPVLEGEPTDEQLLKMNPTDMTPDQLRRAFVLKSAS